MSRDAKLYYGRHLPDWQPLRKELFITWRLAGSLPGAFWRDCKETATGKRFVAFDRALDVGHCGPDWLREPQMAKLVEDALQYGEATLGLHKVLAYVVMSNHVHILIETDVPVQRIMKILKGYTARRGNQILGRVGQRFWQDESFDHWVRSPAERDKIVHYIENNPVSAGLVQRAEDWAWSSAAKKLSMTKTTERC